MMREPLSLLSAAALDAAFGDPPNAAHPVAWFGQVARRIDERAPRTLRAGALGAGGLVGGAALLGAVVERGWPRALGGRWVASTTVLGVVTSRATLFGRAGEVADALDRDDLPEARRLLALHLVSRDTSELRAGEVAAAAIESVAENLSDGVIAPWWWFVAGGLPAAVAYRALNTLDGMWGYRTPGYLAFGRAAARADDVANLLPARLTAGALIVAALLDEDARGAFRTWRADASRTSSPNAGHPMAAMAGALGVRLQKAEEYTLGGAYREPAAPDVRRAIRLADRASVIALAGLALLVWGRTRR